MSLPKSTPRSVTAIAAVDGAVSAVEFGVIPIRGATPPSAPTAAAPTRPAIGRGSRRVPVERRPWRVLLIPPTPGARTRAFDVARWHAKLVLSALVMLLLLAAGAVAAVIVALDRPNLFATTSEVAGLRDRLSALEDSLALARVVLGDSSAMSADSSLMAAATLAGPPSRITLHRVPTFARARSRPTGVRAPVFTPIEIEGLPVVGAIVSGFSNARRHPILHILRPHLGIDIAAARGTRVLAPASGRVTYVGRRFAYGLTVDIEHADGVSTRYAHLRTALVTEGQQIVRGAVIATVGSSGLTTGPHLHYEVAVNGRQVDPLRFRMPHLADSATVSGVPATHESPGATGAPGAPAPR